jgi:hypothetical protein
MGDEPLGREAVLPPERQTSVKIARPIREKMVNGEKARKIGVQGKKSPAGGRALKVRVVFKPACWTPAERTSPESHPNHIAPAALLIVRIRQPARFDRNPCRR